MEISYLRDNGIVELRDANWRGSVVPGDDISFLDAPLQATINAHWADDVGGKTRAERYALQDAVVSAPVDLVAYTAQKRWQSETGGCIWNGWPVATDRESQSKIIAERLAVGEGVRDDPDGWKFADGTFRLLTNVEFVAMSNAVRDHIRNAFAIEAAVLAQIGSGVISTTQEVDAAF